MSDPIITVTVSPAISTFLWMEGLSSDRANPVTKEFEEPSGGALGVSRVLSALRCDNTAIGFCGNENISAFDRLLERFAICHDLIPCPGNTHQEIYMLLPKKTVIRTVREGFRPGCKEIGILFEQLEEYLAADCELVFSGDVSELPILEKWKDAAARLYLSSPKLSMEEWKAIKPYYAIFTLEDFKSLFGIKFRSEQTIIRCVKEMASEVGRIVLCLGTRGYLYADRECCYRMMLPSRKWLHPEMNDFFTAGYLAAKQNGLPLEEMLRYAAGCATFDPGDGQGIFSVTSVQQFAKEIVLERLE